MDDDQPRVLNAMNQIRDYLKLNPHAADTIDGIALWLHRAPPGHERVILQAALDRLVEGGEMLRETLPDGRNIYRKHPAWPPRH